MAAVLCHGYHLQATEWEAVMWGKEDQLLLGRLAATALLCARILDEEKRGGARMHAHDHKAQRGQAGARDAHVYGYSFMCVVHPWLP